MKKLKHGKVTHIDPKTGLETCDPKSCTDKLTSINEIIETNYKWVGGPVKHLFYYSLCKQCNRRTITNQDKKLTNESYKRGTEHSGSDPQVMEIMNG